jgi:hypothetical protein
MSTELADVPTNAQQDASPLGETTHALHVKKLPYQVWCRARHNANLSGLPYRDYVIRLLGESQPFLQQTEPGATK